MPRDCSRSMQVDRADRRGGRVAASASRSLPWLAGYRAQLGSPASAGVGGSDQNERVTRRGLILFAALGIAWGIPYLFIKVAVSELDPAMVVLARSALAAILLLPLAFFRREVTQVVRRWKPMLAYTIVEIILPWYFLSSAEQRLPSSTAGLLLATVPLAGVAIAFAMGRPERLSRAELARHRPRHARRRGAGRPRHRGLRPDRRRRDGGRRRRLRAGPGDPRAVDVRPARASASSPCRSPPPPSSTCRSCCSPAAGRPAWPSTAVIVSIIVLAVVCSALAFLLMVGAGRRDRPRQGDRDHLRQSRGRDHRGRRSCSASGSRCGRSSASRSCSRVRTS